MLFPHQPWAKDRPLARRLRSPHVTSAHVDWIILALLQAAAAVALPRCEARLSDPHRLAWCLVFSGWVAPTTYFVKAFGVNGFRFSGKLNIESLVGLVGFAGVVSHTYAWAALVRAWFGW